MGWKGPTAASPFAQSISSPTVLQQKEYLHYCDSIGIPTKKHLKPGSIPMVLPRSIHDGRSQLPKLTSQYCLRD